MSGEAMPTGRELPGEHWNARIIREEAEAARLSALAESVAVSLQDIADDTSDEQTAERLRDLASQLVRGE